LNRTTDSLYLRRINKCRSYDSISVTCFAIVTSAISEDEAGRESPEEQIACEKIPQLIIDEDKW
jgi:hypothetical protein